MTGKGNDLKLTLDARVCAAAFKALGGRPGAVGAYNYKTGELVCMVSSPSFDPVNPPDLSGDGGKYKGAYINRFLSAAFTPGSVFKLVTAAAAIDHLSDIGEQTFACKGSLTVERCDYLPKAPGEPVSFEKGSPLPATWRLPGLRRSWAAGFSRRMRKRGHLKSYNIDGIRSSLGASIDGATARRRPGRVRALYDLITHSVSWYICARWANGGVPVFRADRFVTSPIGFRCISHFRCGHRMLSADTAEKFLMMKNDVLANSAREIIGAGYRRQIRSAE